MRKTSEKGICCLCCQWAKLTDEHVPPQSSGNRDWTCCHTLWGLQKGSEYKKPPIVSVHRQGIVERSLCESCNNHTQRYYNAAFASWTRQALEYSLKIANETYVRLTFRIKPLNVLKQISTMAIVASQIGAGGSHSLRRLQQFTLHPREKGTPVEFQFLAYLNPYLAARNCDRLLTQNRMTSYCVPMDVVKGTGAFVLSEVAFPPMGYLTTFNTPLRPTEEMEGLTSINFFGNYGLDEDAEVSLRLPVKIPFGPTPAYYPKVG